MYRHSVIIATHNRPLLLGRAIQSVKANVGQEIQVIVVSDVACADTQRVVDSMLSGRDVFVQRYGQPGPAASRNLAIHLIDGDYAVFLDDDDAFTESFFDNVSPHLRPDDVLYTDFHVVFETLDAAGYTPTTAERHSLKDRRTDDVYIKNFIPLHCLIYPAALLRKYRFDPDLILNEDWDFILNVMSEAPLRYAQIEGPVLYKREVTDNRGRRNDHLLPDVYRKIYKDRPAPTQAIKMARKSFLESCGVPALVEDL